MIKLKATIFAPSLQWSVTGDPSSTSELKGKVMQCFHLDLFRWIILISVFQFQYHAPNLYIHIKMDCLWKQTFTYGGSHHLIVKWFYSWATNIQICKNLHVLWKYPCLWLTHLFRLYYWYIIRFSLLRLILRHLATQLLDFRPFVGNKQPNME